MGYLKSTGTVFIYIGLFLTLVAFLPGIPPDAQFSEFSVIPPQEGFTNNPKYSKRLDDAEVLFKGEMKGPESFASYNGELYTTLHGGDVIKIVGKQIVPVVKFGKPCDGVWMEKECGRPLGLYFDTNGILYVADPYNGIFKVDVTSGKYEKLVDISIPIEGAIPKLANSLDIASNGDIYWSDSSREFMLQDGVYSCLANPSGRLIKYDAATKKNIVLLGNLGFANGVKLSKDESFVIVAETLASRLTKFNLKGDKAGRAEPFIQGLPGLPDNIHTDGEDGFLVSLVVVVDAEHPSIVHSLTPHPNIRRMLARILYLLEAPFKLIEDVYPNYYSKRAVHWIGHFESIQPLHYECVGVLRIDPAGKIVDAAFTTDGRISGISSAYLFKDHVYLGSPYNEYLARVPLSRAFPLIRSKPENIVREKVIEKREVKEPAKPTTTTPPPITTTTPKPKPVPTTPKPAPATTQQPHTTTQPPPTQKQQQQQQQGTPKLKETSKEGTAQPVRKVPASSPPPPAPSQKAPVREEKRQEGQKPTGQQASPQPASKPALNEQAAKNVKKTADAQKKPEQKLPPPSTAQKPSESVPVTGKNVEDTKEKKTEQTVRPPVTTPSPPRN